MAYAYKRRNGPRPTERVDLPREFVARIDPYPRAIVAVLGGFPNQQIVSNLLRDPDGIPRTPTNIIRFHRLAEAIGYAGEIFVPHDPATPVAGPIVSDREEVVS